MRRLAMVNRLGITGGQEIRGGLSVGDRCQWRKLWKMDNICERVRERGFGGVFLKLQERAVQVFLDVSN